ncbi:MAG: bifunctional UDP-N-acetylglucosamine diphosphorylase/glucosamine-1-phosphate N-acetyltransferase GlmU [Gammaproteobacteria bacterium]|nr:bifunctional UDP-N-acetylglucosamine diphosphorylase/glucosamine-1-phosphate N-acetyltransferase GlmU [Gammaproteobacteria bacterium]MDH3411940.1 bifunctional UDP-N-acetylglucosamine diphosphorylase/glucosamine-1-phosphate N-acetyltransferase GlmU [Gammaproteobacteria bacterium]
MSPLHVVILAAGQGKRMHSDLPKVLHTLAGRPLLAHVLETAQALGAAGLHVVHGHGGEQVRSQLGNQSVAWVEQPEQLGTGHAVMQALPGVPDKATVLVLYGDVPLVRAQDLESVASAASAKKIGLLTAVVDAPDGYGRILRDDGGTVVGIVEHGDASPEQRAIREINTGILAVSANRLRVWLEDLNNDNRQGEYYLTDVISLAVAEGIAVETVFPESPEDTLGANDRIDLARLERIYQRRQAEALMRAGVGLSDPARLDVRGRVVAGRDVSIDVNVILEGNVRIGERVSIGPNCVLKDVDIGDDTQVLPNCIMDSASVGAGCRIGPYARIRPGTELADSVHIGNFVEVKDSRIGAGSKANHLTYIGDAEIGADVNVGAGTITCNYDGASKHRTVIGDGAFIGSGVELVAPVTVHPGATIGAGSTISKDAPANKLTVNRGSQQTVKRWTRPKKS